MRIERATIVVLMLSSLLASPALAEKVEVLTVAPTIVSKVWPVKKTPEERAAERAAARALAKQNRPKPYVDPVTARLKAIHNRMIAKEVLNDTELRELADSGDGLAAFNYARRLEDVHDTSKLPAAVHYYAMATYLGRDFAMHRLIVLMKSPEVKLSDAQIKSGRDALVKLARSGKTEAAIGLSDMYAQGRPFAQDATESRSWLMQAAEAGDADAAQKLAQAAMMPRDGSPPDLPAARDALNLMLASNQPGKVAIAQALLVRLNGPEPTEVSQ